MKVTLNWLKDYVDIQLSPEELAEKITMAGLEVESIYKESREFSNVVAGKVLSVEKHPDADKLNLCIVDNGSEQLEVVCGAPNVSEGMIVPFAQVGAVLGNDFKITARKVRGILSNGMLCSEMELGLSERADGLMELPADTQVGADMQALMGEPDTVIDIAITSNRPDCLSVIGIAREISAITGMPLRKPEIKFNNTIDDDINAEMRVDIQNADKCARYAGRMIKNIVIKPSPDWLVSRLHAVGVRAINNVVDITNYVMMETGQPLHAFDYKTLAGNTIVVRDAKEGEPFTTLDNQEHKLDSNDLLICDGEKPVALAGVMGGLNSEVENDTTTVFLESAYFEPVTVRKTSTKLGLMTESSRRFERGSDPNGQVYAMDRAAQLMEELAEGQVVESFINNVAREIDPVEIAVKTERVNNLLGTRLTTSEMCDLLKPLEMQVLSQTDETFTIKAPTFRPDLLKPVDISEEVARLYGYNNIDFNMAPQIDQNQEANPQVAFRDKMREYLTGFGFMENVSFSLVSERHANPFLPAETKIVALMNPMSTDMAVFRSSVLISLLTNVAYNRNRQIPNLRFYEIGNAAYKVPGKDEYREWVEVCGILAGKKTENTWYGKEEAFDFYDIKGVVTAFLNKCGIENYELKPAKSSYWDAHSALVLVDGKEVGEFGKIDKKISSLFKIKVQDVFAFCLDFKTIYENRTTLKEFVPVSKFPSSPFDVALLIDVNIPIQNVLDEIWKSAGPYINNVHLFDFYKGEQIQQGKKSVAFSLTFSSKERTLDDEEVDRAVQGVLKHLKTLFGAELRPG